MIDLKPIDLATVHAILAEHVPECEVRAFGSRATWNAKDYSDLDLAVVGDGPLDWRVLGRLKEALEESNLPMRVDVLDWHTISESFKKVIERDYVVLQSKSPLTTPSGDSWQEKAFEDVIDFREGPGILARDFRENGVPLVRLAGLNRGASLLEGCNYLDPKTVSARWSHFKLELGDILLSASASLGRIAVVGEEGVGAVPYTGIIRMRPRDESLYAPFIRYLLEGPHFQQQAEMVGVGSVIRHFGPMHLRQMTVRLPPLPEQRAIAHVLGTLDDKIELNRRMNETLEAMARALFKSWFVDFEPVRAKMEGRWRRGESLPGLPADLYDLFPDRLAPSELGEIPEGWEVRRIEDIAERVAMGPFGSSIKVSTFVDSGVPIISGQHLKGTLLEDGGYRFITEEHAGRLAKANVQRGDIIFTHAGNIGQVAYIPETSTYSRHVISQRQFYLRCDASELSPLFVLHYFKTPGGQHQLLANTSSTGVPSIARPVTYLRSILLCAPPKPLWSLFDRVVDDFHLATGRNTVESRALAAKRDVLLPRLVSGKHRISQQLRGKS